MSRRIVNFAAFQAGWFFCVLSAAYGVPWLGVLATLLVISLHLHGATTPSAEVRLIFVAVAVGAVFDSLLVTSNWLAYPSGMLAPVLAPYWILAMWALFATTLNASLSWLKRLPLLATALLGAIFGPLSYCAGSRLGALAFLNLEKSLIALAIIWAIAMPVLVIAARRFNGMGPDRRGYPLRDIARGEGR